MDPHLLDAVLHTATHAARAAGALMREHAGRVVIDHEKAGNQDIVTAIDQACQKLIEDAVGAAFPAHRLLGEESVAAGSKASTAATIAAVVGQPGWLWVIDPIDGTTNFVAGIPFSVVSIGVSHDGELQVGVVYDPYRDELFSAVKGRGTWLHTAGGAARRQCVVSPEPLMRNALFAYGLHHTPSVAHTMLDGVRAITDVSRGARCLGSAALHLVGGVATRGLRPRCVWMTRRVRQSSGMLTPPSLGDEQSIPTS